MSAARRAGPVERWRWVSCGVVVLALLGSACANGTPANDGTPSPSPDSPTASPATESVLGRHDTPPLGIEQQFTYFQEGDGLCSGLDAVSPSVTQEGPEPAIATRTFFCFAGFQETTPVDGEVEGPDGSVRSFHVDTYSADGVPFLEWVGVPGDALGAYQVTGRQGSIEATASFTVSLPPNPRVLLLPPIDGPPGTTFRLAMAGFPPGGSVPLYLYRAGDAGIQDFVTTLPSAQMDPDGTTVYSIVSLPGDPDGTYCVVHTVGTEEFPEFCSATFAVTG